MITTLLLDYLNFIWYGLFELIWPKSVAGLDLNTISTSIAQVSAMLRPGLAIANIVIPMDTLFIIANVFILLYISLFIFRAARLIASIFRPGIK